MIEDLPDCPARDAVLAPALRSPDPDVREAAEEAFFSLGNGDFGYEASGDPVDREAAVRRFLENRGRD